MTVLMMALGLLAVGLAAAVAVYTVVTNRFPWQRKDGL